MLCYSGWGAACWPPALAYSSPSGTFLRTPLAAKGPAGRAGTNMFWISVGGLACLATATVVLVTGIQTVQVAVVGFVSLIAATPPYSHPARGDRCLLRSSSARICWCVSEAGRGRAAIELYSGCALRRSRRPARSRSSAASQSRALSAICRPASHAAADLNLVTDLWATPAGICRNTLATVPFQDHVSNALARLRRDVRAVHVYAAPSSISGIAAYW